MNSIRAAAEFILTVPPIQEITDVFIDIVERFRHDMLTKEEATNELISCYQNELNSFVQNNTRINEQGLYSTV